MIHYVDQAVFVTATCFKIQYINIIETQVECTQVRQIDLKILRGHLERQFISVQYQHRKTVQSMLEVVVVDLVGTQVQLVQFW